MNWRASLVGLLVVLVLAVPAQLFWPIESWTLAFWVRSVVVGVIAVIVGEVYAAASRRRRVRREQSTPRVDLMDPHGDGTIREGDELFKLFERSLENGYAVGRVNDRGELDIEEPK